MTRFTRLTTTALIASAWALTATQASAWQADNFHTVNAVSDTVFEVIGQPGSAGPEYWCAAGDYARRVLGAAPTQRIYIVRGRAAPVTSPRKSGVQFSLTRPIDVDPTRHIWLSVTHVGENLNAASAQNYCLDRKTLEF